MLKPDYTQCDQEPIHKSGGIQPHGFLLALNSGLAIIQHSNNAIACLGTASLLTRSLASVAGQELADILQQLYSDGLIQKQPRFVSSVTLATGMQCDVLAHYFDQLLVLEFEKLPGPEKVTAGTGGQPRFSVPHSALNSTFNSLISEFLEAAPRLSSLTDICDQAAQQIRKMTGFGRILINRFDEDDHGHVLAESVDARHTSYAGQRFPASDIPQQARQLYIANRIRLIPDASYVPVGFTPPLNPVTGAVNDLTFSTLRSVSPVHLAYMRNMGTQASMSFSLVIKGQLWGMISCHDQSPSPVPFVVRSVCEQLGHILSLKVETLEDAGEYRIRQDMRRILVGMLAGMDKGPDFIDNMKGVLPQYLQFVRALGGAIVVDGRIETCGDAPSEEAVRALADWLDESTQDEIFHTDCLSDLYPPAAEYAAQGSGLLAISISRIHRHYLLWFRPEILQTIEWAGNPYEPKEASASVPAVLSPRRSFGAWREIVHRKSARWHVAELEIATELRTALLGIALERAEQMASLAEELTRSNKELEAFSYSVSHDLRAPLRHIVGFSDILLSTAEDEVSSERRQRFLQNIKDSAHLAGKLVDDLLSFSQMGRAALKIRKISLEDLVRSCINKLEFDLQERQIDWQIGTLPEIQADPVFLQLALFNLLSNAVKFTRHRERARIAITATDNADSWTVQVADNGVGFNMNYVHKLFGVFQRLHRMEEFQGTGIGLANVRRIIERHGGTVQAVSEPDQGAVFSFSLPKAAPASD